MFKPIRFESGRLQRMRAKGSITFTKGNALKNDSGYVTNSASGDNTDVKFIAWEDKVTGGSDGEMLLCYRVAGGVQLEADASNTPTQAQMLVAVDLSAASTIDTSATTDAVFFAEYPKMPLSDKKIVGYFVDGVINS